MGLAELVFHKVSQLPQDKVAEVLDFVQFLELKQQTLSQSQDESLDDFVDLLLSMPKVKDVTVFDRVKDVEMRDVFN